MSIIYHNDTEEKYGQKIDENADAVGLTRHNYFLLCNDCLWMASMPSILSSKYLDRCQDCPICYSRINRFPISEHAN